MTETDYRVRQLAWAPKERPGQIMSHRRTTYDEFYAPNILLGVTDEFRSTWKNEATRLAGVKVVGRKLAARTVPTTLVGAGFTSAFSRPPYFASKARHNQVRGLTTPHFVTLRGHPRRSRAAKSMTKIL